MQCISLTALVLLFAANVPKAEAGIATLAIDFGSEWIKMGIVKPGTPMDIVLNRESKRKTANVVALRRGERTFGASALGTSVKYPKNGFRYLTELLGQKMDSDVVQRYQAQFPEHTLEADAERGTVVFRLDEETTYTVEELVAMILEHVNEVAGEYAEQVISSHVIIIPPYFDQAARRALLSAADLAGLNVLRLMSSSVATGLNYGVFRRKEFNTTEQHIMFYDMGSTSTIATVGSFSIVKDKETRNKVPQFVVKGVGYDRTLGGFEWDQRLQAHLLEAFQDQYKGKLSGDPSTNPRALAKLLKEAQRVRAILSANTETFAQIEGLFEERDFKVQVTRDTLEELSKDLYPRVGKPVEDALAAAGLTMTNISHFIVIGGGVRMPKVQSILVELNQGQDLTKNLNGDETFAMGGAYEAAALSKAFRVKKFITKDLNLKNVAMHTTRTITAEDGTTSEKPIHAIVFGLNSSFPARKTMKLNITEDFEFEVLYGGQTSEDGILLSQHKVAGVADAFKSNMNNNATFKGVKVRFELDLSGLLNVSRIEAQFEGPEEPEEDSMLKKIGDSIGLGSLFGDSKKGSEDGGDDDDDTAGDDNQEATESSEAAAKDAKAEAQEDVDDAGTPKDKTEDKEEETGSSDAADKAETEGDKAETDSADDSDKADSNTTQAPMNATANNTTNTTGKADKKPKAKKDRTVRVVLSADVDSRDVQALAGTTYQAAKERLLKLKEAEERKRRTEASLNTLESFIFDTRDKLYQEEYETVTTEEERDSIREKLTETSDWLEEDGWEAEYETFDSKLELLNASMKDVQYRVTELRNRPQAIKDLNQTLNLTTGVLLHMKNVTANVSADDEMPPWYTEKEISDLEKLYNETMDWLAEKVKAQEESPLTEAPVLKVSTLTNKNRKLSREMMYLVKKKPPIKPKKIKAKKNVTATADNTTKIEVNGTDAGNTTLEEDGVDATTEKPTEVPPVETPTVAEEDAPAQESVEAHSEADKAAKLDDEL